MGTLGSLADGLRALRELALTSAYLTDSGDFRGQLLVDLVCEAQKFGIFRLWKMHDRELLCVYRIRSLCRMLKSA